MAAEANFAEECLKAHNEYRQRHGVQSLVLSKKLCAFSEQWARTIAARGVMQHSSGSGYGENIYSAWSSSPNFKVNGRDAVDSWYKEIKDYTFGRGSNGRTTGHFTQVVWKTCTELGVGFAKSARTGHIFVVANYSPQGNFIGRYNENVPPIGGFPGDKKPMPIKVEEPKPNVEEDESSDSGDSGDSSDSSDSGDTSDSSGCGNDFEKEGLKSHNDYRRRHGVPLLKINPELTRYAQEWADNLARSNSFNHRQNGKYGENLYAMSGSTSDYHVSAKDACDMWYAEIKDFHFGYEPATLAAGHFTAMIWKNTTELGMAMARSNNRVVIVANYNPWGNYTGQYTANCPRPIEITSVEKTKKTKKTKKAVVEQPKSKVEPEESSESSDSDASSDCGNGFEKEGLKLHNEFRRRHGVPLMKINPEMTRYAQEWADNLISNSLIQHRQNGKYGESLFVVTGCTHDHPVSAKDVCDTWYAEIKDFSFGYEPKTLAAGHFTAMIWKNTTELGMAMARSNDRVVVVANYNPWGNYIGQFTENCPRPIESASDEKATKSKAEKPKPTSSAVEQSKPKVEQAKSSEYGSAFEKEGLKAHNDYRKRHGCPLMTLKPELTRYAQEWADHLARTNSFHHRTNGKFAESLYAMMGSGNLTASAKDACDSWYSEIKDYRFGYEPTSLKAGHFTAMIWKNTTELGMAMVKTNNRIIIVATYNPWPNVTGQYRANIPRLL